MTAPLRPFWGYYGAKWSNAHRYQPPEYRTIVEPFAGSGYSLHWPARDVRLFDVDPIVVGIWDYLIRVTPAEVQRLPAVVETPEDVPGPQEARWLVGFWLQRGSAEPAKRAGAWMRSGKWPEQFWGPHARSRIARQVEHVRHWNVKLAGYEEGIQRRG